MKRVALQPAYVLHRRAYRETSFLVDILTQEYGRLTVIAKGVRQAKSASAGLLQPFQPLLISWVGRGELMTLTDVELKGGAVRLQGDCLFAGFYLNELIMALLQRFDPHAVIFNAYVKTMLALQDAPLNERALRSFEKKLLEELGYGLLRQSDTLMQNALQDDKYYRFVPEQGFVLSELGDSIKTKANLFSGKSLRAIANEDWSLIETLRDAKRLTRYLLAPLLGARQIYSRQLFLQLDESVKHDA